MGAVFDITAKLRIKDVNGFIAKGKKFIETYDADFCLDRQAKLGHTTNTIKGIIGIVFVDSGGSLFVYKEEGAQISFCSGFNASYGWEGLMMDFFTEVSPTLEAGSKLIIEPDSGFDVLTLKEDGSIKIEEEEA